MASIINPNCKFVIVYTNNTTKLQQTLVITSGNTQTLPKNITINSVTKFGTGCIIDKTSDCGDISNITVKDGICIGTQFGVSDGDQPTHGYIHIYLQGFRYNNKIHLFDNEFLVDNSDKSVDLANAILSNSDLANIIYNPCLKSYKAASGRGSSFILTFNSIPDFINDGFLIARAKGEVDTAETKMYIPLQLRSDITDGGNIITQCPCS